MTRQKYLIVVGGPTASGKTGMAIRLAAHFGTEIISCDSRQFYREMTIGTAKPTLEELSKVPHHLINSLSIEESYSVGQFERDALNLLASLFSDHDVVILTGGSGLFIKALCEGLDYFPEVPKTIRQELESLYQKEGIEALQEALKKADPAYYEEVDQQNPHRLIRALSVFRASGLLFSAFRKQSNASRNFHPVYLQMHWPRALLYQRINQRVDQMIASGLLEEASLLYPERQLAALQTVGYQELFIHFSGSITQEEAINQIKQNSRRYAKRQLTWLRRDGFWKHVRTQDFEVALDYIERATSLDLHFAHIEEEASKSLLEFRQLDFSEEWLNSIKWRACFVGKKVWGLQGNWRFPKYNVQFFCPIEEDTNAGLLYLMAHECALSDEEGDIYLINCSDTELLFTEYGFENIIPDLLPGKIRSIFATIANKYSGNLELLHKSS